MDEIRIGDRVQRERGKQTIGVVERIFTPTYGKRYPVAKVRWLDSFAKFSGGTRDHHSTVAVVSLRKVDEPAATATTAQENASLIVAHEEDGEPIFASKRAGGNG